MTAQNDSNNSENQIAQNHSDFSIEHILNRAGSSTSSNTYNICDGSTTHPELPLDPYSWLQCTRYCPPKVPRTHKKDAPQRRQLGRHPRIPFTSHQLSVLEQKFQHSQYLSSEEVIMLGRQLQLADVRVKIWFQNRRARERREKLQNVGGRSPEVKKEKDVTSDATVVSDNSVRPSPEPRVYNLFPVQAVFQSHLTNYFVPITNVTSSFNCTSKDTS